jgi:hypothetical protein
VTSTFKKKNDPIEVRTKFAMQCIKNMYPPKRLSVDVAVFMDGLEIKTLLRKVYIIRNLQ